MTYPTTEIVLCRNVPLDNSYDHQLTFASQQAQATYFYTKAYRTLQQNTYQRVMMNKLRIQCSIGDAMACNYLFFSNNSHESKTIYAFITGWEYVNDVTTEITYEIDVFQTFWFDIDIKPSFVEREHSLTDAIGGNTVPETLEQGEYIIDGISAFEPYNIANLVNGGVASAIFYCTFSEDTTTSPPTYPRFDGGMANYCYTGLLPIKKNSVAEIQTFLANVTAAGKIDGIVAAYMCPYEPLTYDPIQWSFQMPKHNTTLAGYTPKNKKLFTYPYNCLRVRTDSDSTIYRWEFFRTANAQFTMEGYIVPDPVLTLIPKNYNASTDRNYCIENRLTIKEFPQVAFNVDVWKVYFAQHGASLVTSMIGDGINAGASILATGLEPSPSATLGAASALTNIAKSVAQIYEIQKRPPELKGSQTSMADYAIGAKKFYADNLCIRPEYARIIDEYFSMFGYATHRVKVPNITGRPYWNYVKTHGIVLDVANAPQPYIQKLIDCFNRGITFWHDPANVGNYALDNSPSF